MGDLRRYVGPRAVPCQAPYTRSIIRSLAYTVVDTQERTYEVVPGPPTLHMPMCVYQPPWAPDLQRHST